MTVSSFFCASMPGIGELANVAYTEEIGEDSTYLDTGFNFDSIIHLRPNA